MNEDDQKYDMVDLQMFCLASIIYHSDALKRITRLHPGHPLYQIPRHSDDDLLYNLKPLGTTDPYEIMGSPIGIRTHGNVMYNVTELLTILKEEWGEHQQLLIILCK